MTTRMLPLLFALTTPIAALAQASDTDSDAAHHGRAMHNEHCVKCHDDQVYTRDNRRITTLPALGVQVRRCRDNLGIHWFDEDTDAVVNYLNSRYYKF